MNIDYKQLRRYMECPMKYHLMYNEGRQGDPVLRERFDDCIRKTILFYYYCMMNGTQISQEKLKQKWGSLWFKDMDPEEMALRQEHWRLSDTRKIELEGASMIINFYRQNQYKKVLPIAVNYDFSIPIGNHVLTDSIELIRQVEDRQDGRVVEVVHFKTSDYKPDMFITTHDLRLTMQVYAYRKLFDMKEQRILYHFLKGGKEIYSYRNEQEMKKFEATVNGVASAIENKLFYPQYSFMCSACPLKMECDSYKF